MRVLILHNRYRHTGGEDTAAAAEWDMLRRHGVEVMRHEFHNEVAGPFPILGAARLAMAAPWSRDSYAQVRSLCAEYRPDIVHVHNFWMRLSPSVHAACHDAGAVTVQSLHNFRLLCTNGMFLRDGRTCEDCLGKSVWRGVVRRCQHGSLAESAAVAGMVAANRHWGTWQRDVDAFITPSQYSRTRFVAGGIPAPRTFVKPNFTADPGPAPEPASSSDTAMVAGRLSQEKGFSILLQAWARARAVSGKRLLLVGDGPAREALETECGALGLRGQVTFTGYKSPAEVRELLMGSRFALLPSLCGESFGTSLIEALACARPAITTDLGGQAEVVRHGVNGFLVPPGDAAALADALDRAYSSDEEIDRLGANARSDYRERYTEESNFKTLLQIYRFALGTTTQATPAGIRKNGVTEVSC